MFTNQIVYHGELAIPEKESLLFAVNFFRMCGAAKGVNTVHNRALSGQSQHQTKTDYGPRDGKQLHTHIHLRQEVKHCSAKCNGKNHLHPHAHLRQEVKHCSCPMHNFCHCSYGAKRISCAMLLYTKQQATAFGKRFILFYFEPVGATLVVALQYAVAPKWDCCVRRHNGFALLKPGDFYDTREHCANSRISGDLLRQSED